MPRQCEYCGKGTKAGGQVSHAHNVSKRTFRPNLQKVRAWIDGSVKRVYVCSRCLRSGKVRKPPARDWQPEEASS
ncbi:MAG: 50S ribosomal protein L28 [Thermoanaerobaculia bacterium]|nr:50S ribosomal protein L28 [Thermoanaerobaculia bacterium]